MPGYEVPFVHQNTKRVCWEACLRMMWYWKYRTSTSSKYHNVVDAFLAVDAGASTPLLDQLCTSLGMAGTVSLKAVDLIGQLQRSPVLITLPYIPSRQINLSGNDSHALLALEYKAAENVYVLVDPMTPAKSSSIACRDYTSTVFNRLVDRRRGAHFWYWTLPPGL